MKNILENDFGFRDTALQWIISFLTDRKQHVVIHKSTSKPFDLSSGVPQGSCLGPILFIMYASRLFHVIDKHLPDAQGYADDTQLYLSFRRDSTSSQEEALRALEGCVADIRAWMVNHQLKLNDNKTEFIIIGSRHQLSKVRMDSINVGLSEIKSASSLRDLGAWFDECMTMNKHVSKVCSKAFGALYKISKIRKFLTEETTDSHPRLCLISLRLLQLPTVWNTPIPDESSSKSTQRCCSPHLPSTSFCSCNYCSFPSPLATY